MENKKIIIIGAGIAGMSVGCYLQMNGYETVIYEKSNSTGGLCTGWKRGDYYFDGCISWLIGSGPRNTFYKFWKELNVIQNMHFINEDEFAVVKFKDGNKFTLYSDVDKLEEEFLRVAPDDKDKILSLTNAIREISNSDLNLDKSLALLNEEELKEFVARAGSYIKITQEWSKITIEEFAKSFKSEFVRKNYKRIFWFKHYENVARFITTMTYHNVKAAGYPIEGSSRFSQIIEERYISLGGKINYNSEVSEILVKNNVTVGVKLKNEKTDSSNLVISAADGYNTIFEMLKGKYIDEEIKYCYDNFTTSQGKIHVALGVAKKLDKLPHYMNLELDVPINTYNGESVDNIHVKVYNRHPSFAPEGKTSIIAYADTTYEYWEKLRRNNYQKYSDEKLRIANEMICALDKYFEGIKAKVEVIDVSTPYTVKRYTSNRNGSWMGWSRESECTKNDNKLKMKLPTLDGFYMIGHWSKVGGGLPPVLLQARDLVQLICKVDGKEFTTINN